MEYVPNTKQNAISVLAVQSATYAALDLRDRERELRRNVRLEELKVAYYHQVPVWENCIRART